MSFDLPFQAGGFSANGQPIDQCHHLLRAKFEEVDAEDVGYGMDLRKRESNSTYFHAFLFGFLGGGKYIYIYMYMHYAYAI